MTEPFGRGPGRPCPMRHALRVLAVVAPLCLSGCNQLAPLLPQKEGRIRYVGMACDYKNTSVSHLYGTINDVTEFGECYRLLARSRGIGFEQTWLLDNGAGASEADDGYPSKENVLETLRNLDPGPEDLVVFAYSGHGNDTVADVYGNSVDEPCIVTAMTEARPLSGTVEKDGGTAVWIPSETARKTLREMGYPSSGWAGTDLDFAWHAGSMAIADGDADGDPATMDVSSYGDATITCDVTIPKRPYDYLPLSDLVEVAKGWGCATVLVMDSCYSGSAVPDAAWERRTAPITGSNDWTSIAVMAAGSVGELTYETGTVSSVDPGNRHGMFFAAILSALGWEQRNAVCSVIEAGGRNVSVYGALSDPPAGEVDVGTLFDRAAAIVGSMTGRQTPTVETGNCEILLLPAKRP